MSFLMPPYLRKILLNIYTRGGVQGSIQAHCIILSPLFHIGKHSFVNRRCLIDNGQAMVTIGNNCAIACDVKFLTTNHDFSDTNRRAGKVYGKEIIIEDGCWIGAGATILPGTHIYQGVVIAAGSVVRGEIESNSIYAGIPAKKIKELNPQ